MADQSVSLLDAIYKRHSVRSYLLQSIEESAVKDLLAAAVQAPTGLDIEPWAFVVIQDRALLKRVSDHAKVFFLQEMRRNHYDSAGSNFAHIEDDPDFNLFGNAGTLILICAKSVGPFATADCWLAAENLMLAATAIGLGSCVVGAALSGLNTSKMKAELGIPDVYMVMVPIIVGIPTSEYVSPPRKKPKILAWKRAESSGGNEE